MWEVLPCEPPCQSAHGQSGLTRTKEKIVCLSGGPDVIEVSSTHQLANIADLKSWFAHEAST